MINLTCLAPGAKVSAPGFYRMAAEQYHADPCIEPSLSSSIARTLIERSPRHAHHEHPRLGGGAAGGSTAAMDLGSLAGRLILGEGPQFVVLDYDDWRTAKAKDARDDAIAAGKIPVLSKTFEQAEALAGTLRQRVRESHAPYIFDHAAEPQGHPEIVACWQDEGTWCRAMFDWLIPGRFECVDLKVTGAELNPYSIGRKIADMGYEVQQSWYTRGLEALMPSSAGRWKFRFVFAEADAPHEILIVENDSTAREMGRRKVAYALFKWKLCLSLGIWPGLSGAIQTAVYPSYAETSWLTREEEDPNMAGVTF